MDPIILLVIAGLGLAGFTILLFAAWFMMRDQRTKKTGRKAAPKPAAPAPLSLSDAPAVSSGGAPAGQPQDANAYEVLRVLRDSRTSRLFIEIAGARYECLEDIRDGAVYRGLTTTMADLQAFTNTDPASPAAAASARVLPPNFGLPEPPLQTPSMNPFKQAAVLREMAKNPPPVPLTIAEQIDRTLQDVLAGTPHAKRGLRVTTGPTGAALFHADGKSYDSVDQVPDPDAQALIRAAVAEWEKTQ